jgi:hypothetical protein
MLCPKCCYSQYCPCPSCADRLPPGVKPWIVSHDGNSVSCAKCGHTDSYDGWQEEEWKQFNKTKRDKC